MNPVPVVGPCNLAGGEDCSYHKKRPADAHAAGGLFWFARENEGFPPIFKVLRLAWEMKKLNEQNYKTTCIR